jgi:hypothetical protein
VRPRRLASGESFTWRFKTKDYWQAVPAPGAISTVDELMGLHEPWVTSSAAQVLSAIRSHGGEASIDDEGLIVVEVDDADLSALNADLEAFGCTLSNELLHTV